MPTVPGVCRLAIFQSRRRPSFPVKSAKTLLESPQPLPLITKIAAGRLEKLKVFGNDYPTPDGTGIRDYLHVIDLAEAHAAAVEHLLQVKAPHSQTLNLGTGHGMSVLDVVKGFEAATGISIPYEIVERRREAVKLEACPKRAKEMLGWTAKRTLADMCRDGWAWQSANPQGYREI